VEVEGIKDQESLRAWLESLPKLTEAEHELVRCWAVAIAHRAAMRVLPVFWNSRLAYEARKRDLKIDTILIANLFCSFLASSKYPTFNKMSFSVATRAGAEAFAFDGGADAAFSATYAISANYFGPEHAALSAEYAADAYALACGTSKEAVWHSIRADCIALCSGGALETTPLWMGHNPLRDLWFDLRPKVLSHKEDWHFWVEWYDNALYGRPQDTNILTKIALINQSDWDKSPEHINALIQQIVAAHKPKPKPELPKLTDVERSHIALVLAAPEPARQSAEFLRDQFQCIETAYIRAIGCPNETPPEIEPIATLARCFGVIACLLRDTGDKDQTIAELTLQIRLLEANNAQLAEALQSSHRSFMREVATAAVGGVASAMIISASGFLGGPFISQGLHSLWELLRPNPPFVVSPMLPTFEV
jgi:hypothetical protein